MASNLVSNAVKFTPAGGQVSVSLVPAGDHVDLVVEDTGCGIAPEHLPHIFERFYRVPASDPSPEKGLGLGLNFVAWIAKAHGGAVSVDSTPGKGTCFRVSLPQKPGLSSAAETHVSPIPVDTIG
jgi:hypothetical protein